METTQTKKLVASIGATAAFTALLTGGITAVHQYNEDAASADTVAGFNDFQNRIAQAKAAAADNSDHCKIHTGAFDELSYTPQPGESAHVSGSSFGLIGTSGTFNAVPADDGIAAYNCRWALTIKTNAVKYGIDGDELKDDVTVASDPTYGRDPWLVINHEMAPATVHGQVYYMKNKPELTYTLPSGAQLIGETDLDFNEPGTKTASIAKPATALNNGYIVWVWSVDRNKQPGTWGKYMDANFIDGWGAENEVVTLPKQEDPVPTPTPTPTPAPSETTPTPAPKPTPSLPDHDGVTPPPVPVPTPEPTPAPAPTTGEVTPTPKPSETTPAPVIPTPEETTPAPTPVPDPSATTPAPNPSETNPVPSVPTPGETTPAPAPSTPGNATTDPTPAPNGTTEAPTPGSQDGNKPEDQSGTDNSNKDGDKQNNEQSATQNGSKSANGSTSVDHQGATLAHTGSTTLPLLGGAALLLVAGSALTLTKRAKA